MSNVHILSHQNLDLLLSYLHLWRHTGWKANCILMEWIYDKPTFIIHLDKTNDTPFTYWPWTLGFIKHVSIVFVIIYGTLGVHPSPPPCTSPPILGILVLFLIHTKFPHITFLFLSFFFLQSTELWMRAKKYSHTLTLNAHLMFCLCTCLTKIVAPPPPKKRRETVQIIFS